MRGVAPRYPAFDDPSQAPLTLAGRINACRVRHQQAPAFAPESEALLGLEAFVAIASRGLPIAPPADARLAPWRAQGERLYRQRVGQLDLACAQCHEGLAAQRLGGSVIPQGHATGYPLYRLEWQGLGSLQRRIVASKDFRFDYDQTAIRMTFRFAYSTNANIGRALCRLVTAAA